MLQRRDAGRLLQGDAMTEATAKSLRIANQRRQVIETVLSMDRTTGDILRIYGPIGDKGLRGSDVAGFIAAADETRNLTLLIDSPGGTIEDARLIINALAGRKGPTHAAGISVVASAATLIMAACQRRSARPYTKFNLHYSASSDVKPDQRATAERLRSIAGDPDALDGAGIASILVRVGQ